MEGLHGRVAISVNENVFLKDPTGTELGRRIVRASIDLIDDLGFEDFTFKKLALAIGSTEASVYRYFENKHNLLAYLTMWYWGWMEYRIVMSTLNIEDPKVRLRNAIKALTESIEEDSTFSPYPLGDQNTQSFNSGRMKLKKLHIFKGNSSTRKHCRPIAGISVSVGSGSKHSPESAGREKDCLGFENMEFSR